MVYTGGVNNLNSMFLHDNYVYQLVEVLEQQFIALVLTIPPSQYCYVMIYVTT